MIQPPEIKVIPAGYDCIWLDGPEEVISLKVLHLSNSNKHEITGELELNLMSADTPGSLRGVRVNLQSQRARADIAKRLKDLNQSLDWVTITDLAFGAVLDKYREGEPVLKVGKKPEKINLEFQLNPILEKNQPTTIYGPGGYLKSYLADYIACLVQFDIAGIPDKENCWLPARGNVLYLDWESGIENHERRVWAIKRGLDFETEDTFLYRFCSQPLVNDMSAIQKLVAENDIALVVVDSQMAATGYGLDPAQTATQYYNALRSLKCTTLTLDHVSKEEWKRNDTDSIGPYGPVVKYNRSRSQFEIKKSQNAGDDFVELALIHRKHNEGKLLKPIGIRVNFNQDSEGQLESVTFDSCGLADNPQLSKSLTLWERAITELKSGSLPAKTLAEQLGCSRDTLESSVLYRYKDIFVKVGKSEWGLKTFE